VLNWLLRYNTLSVNKQGQAMKHSDFIYAVSAVIYVMIVYATPGSWVDTVFSMKSAFFWATACVCGLVVDGMVYVTKKIKG